MRIVVLGAGLAGLTFALEATRRGHEVTVVEEEKPGGLLVSVAKDGYTVDLGGSHIIFSRDREKLEFLLDIAGRDNLIKHRRDTRIYYNGSYVKYPFENGAYMLPPQERFEILKGVVEAYVKRMCGDYTEPKNFEEWIYSVFGEAIAEKYLVPYNKKLWKRDLAQISLEWVAGRVPLPPLEDVMRSAVGIPTEGYTHQLTFYYPRRGGIYALIRGLLDRLRGRRGFKLVTGFRVEEIYVENGTVRVSDGSSEEEGDLAVSTAPMPETLRMLGGEAKRRVSGVFDYNSLLVVGLGGEGSPPPYHWVYFPQKEVVFHRLAILSNYSPLTAPKGKVLLIAEVSAPPGTSMGEREVYESLEWVRDLGFLSDGYPVAWKTWRYAYIVYRHGYGRLVGEASALLREKKVIPLGRFGSWRYMNMDDTAHQARAAARELGAGGR